MKKYIKIVIAVIIVIIALCIITKIRENENLTIDGITNYFEEHQNEELQIMIQEIRYTESAGQLLDLIQVDKWEKMNVWKPVKTEPAVLKIIFSDGYGMYIYRDYISVYDDYASIGKENEVFYKISDEIFQNIASYVEEK